MTKRSRTWLMVAILCVSGLSALWAIRSGSAELPVAERTPARAASPELSSPVPKSEAPRIGLADAERAASEPVAEPTTSASVDGASELPDLTTMLSDDDTRLPGANSALHEASLNPERKTLSELDAAELERALRAMQATIDEARNRALAARDEHADLLFASGLADDVPAGSKYPGESVDGRRSPGHTTVLRGGANGTSGVQFEALDVPEVRTALVEARTRYVAALETAKAFIAERGR
ncbi:MAG: hypothetical protein K8S98_10265 [Planctomycetes bacterium]|nr:hypothetical protein [Planctomycetota bacterium]